jgi:hypothetical protein
LPVLANLFARATFVLTGSRWHIVNNAVAIVVFAVADLWFGLGARATSPFAIFAHSHTSAAIGLAWSRWEVVDQAIAIVVKTVAEL